MSGKLRPDDPPRGREGFDGRAGWEWERGPNPNDITDSTPDVPWNKLKPCPTVFPDADFGQWVVTNFGLHVLASGRERYEAYEIPAHSLCDVIRDDGRMRLWWPWKAATESWIDFDAFETAFRAAIEKHRLRVDIELLDSSFRKARDMRLSSIDSPSYNNDQRSSRLIPRRERLEAASKAD